MNKLIKLSNTHYIIVDDSNITQACYIYKTHKNIHGRGIFYLSSDIDFEAFNKEASDVNVITHSTQPLEYTTEDHLHWDKIKPLALSEVKELIYGYSVEKMAEERYPIYPFYDGDELRHHDTNYELRTGFIQGFKAHQELVKDKLLSTHLYSNNNHLEWVYNRMIEVHGENPNYDYMIKFKEIIQSLLPKTEWECCISDGKLVLL